MQQRAETSSTRPHTLISVATGMQQQALTAWAHTHVTATTRQCQDWRETGLGTFTTTAMGIKGIPVPFHVILSIPVRGNNRPTLLAVLNIIIVFNINVCFRYRRVCTLYLIYYIVTHIMNRTGQL